MRKEKIQELSFESFRIFGSFARMLNPDWPKVGEKPSEFFRDMLLLNIGQHNLVSFSTCRITKRDLVVDCTEYHNYTGEAILPLDGDILIHVGPATSGGEVPYEDIKIFRVPQGTMVILNTSVWHGAPFAYNRDYVNVLIALPERVYAIDCPIKQIPKDKQIWIEEK